MGAAGALDFDRLCPVFCLGFILRFVLGLVLRFVGELADHFAVGFHHAPVAVDFDPVRIHPVRSLPGSSVAFVMDVLVLSSGDHLVRHGLHHFVVRKHGGGCALAVRLARGRHVTIGGVVSRFLIHHDTVGVHRAGGIQNPRRAVQRHQILGLVERGFVPAGAPVALFVLEVGGLFQADQSRWCWDRTWPGCPCSACASRSASFLGAFGGRSVSVDALTDRTDWMRFSLP